ncbi:MAG TPA: proton-conducting transporter membrane subunit [Chloroflexota bacterium]|nr:proton-conducting transporter membrane subunit [Chloroflexota bacterium]
MPPGDAVSNSVSTLFSAPSASSSHLFDGLVGPIVPGFFGVDALSLAILIGLAALGALLILSAPATGDFFRYLFMLIFFLVGALGVVTATHVVTFFVAWEITSLFAWGIGQIKGTPDEGTEEGVVPYHAAGALGSFAMLLGLGLLAMRGGLALGPVPATASLGPAPYLILAGLLLKTFGILSEGWYLQPGRRFTIAGATLAGAGVLVIGLYPFFRFFGPILGLVAGWHASALLAMAILTVVTALAALGEADYRRALSYGAFSQFAFLGTIYLTGSAAATTGAVIGAIADAFAFTGLFLCLSAAEEASAQVYLPRVGGLAQRLPITAAFFALCALSVIGLPPLGGFVADRLIGVAAQSGGFLPIFWMVVVGLTLLYLARLFVSIFLGELHGVVRSERRLPAIILSGGVIGTLVLLGLLSADLLALLAPAAQALAG